MDDQKGGVPQTTPSTDADLGHLATDALVLHLISVEVGHEVTHTLNYLRFLMSYTTASAVPSDLFGFAGQEIERLERLLGHLRPFKLPPLALVDVGLRESIEDGFSVIRDACVHADVAVVLEVPGPLRVRADAAYLATALRCLAKHAVSSAPPGTTITVRVASGDLATSGSALVEMIDIGPALPDIDQGTPFDVWHIQPTESQAARRLFAHRLVRNMGGALAYERVGPNNVFRLTLALAQGWP